jgi:hypothetical protein
MNNKQIRARFGLAALSILLVLAMLAALSQSKSRLRRTAVR